MTSIDNDEASVSFVPSPSPTTRSGASETATPKFGSLNGDQRERFDGHRFIDHPAFPLESTGLPKPLPSNRCPLFCCFYSEFDIKVGPKVCFQSPVGFMTQQVDISVEQIEHILSQALQEIYMNPHSSRSGQEGIDGDSDNENSIFDSCSEYIITGSELTGKIINLSTNHIHVLSCPTMISDERYERNSLLFSVGFILRRTEDSRPFRPLLNKWASALRDLELESHYLSTPSTRPLIQRHLERLLVSLNSPSWECSVLLNQANVINLKLFHPPKLPAPPVSEYSVPIFLRRDRQMHMYDWDLAINWVSLHIDGVTNARQISLKSEVDMEMVLSCLRVLRHHGVIALVDMFFYTNRYECTETVGLLRRDSELLESAATYVMHHLKSNEQQSPSNQSASSACQNLGDLGRNVNSSPSSSFDHSRFHNRQAGSYYHENEKRTHSNRFVGETTASVSSVAYQLQERRQRENHSELKAALFELFLSCNRNQSIGELWIDLMMRRENTDRTNANADIDWKSMFQVIDHRRFISFGITHGLLRRVHCFPMILDDVAAQKDEEEKSPSFCRPANEKDERLRPGGRLKESRDDDHFVRERLALMMDGRHCDDELVCTFNRSYQELMQLLGGRHIVSAYAIPQQ